jgi:hypothetical protein
MSGVASPQGYYWFYRLTVKQTGKVITTQVFDDFASYINSINPGINISVLKEAIDMIDFDVLLDKGAYTILRTEYPINYDCHSIV